MKSLIRNQKCVIFVLLTLLIVFSVNFMGYAEIMPVSDRTPQVRDAIVAAVQGVNNAGDVTVAHLKAITHLHLRKKGISMLKAGDFSGLTALTSLNLYQNQLRRLPDGIFKGLTALTTIRLGRNTVDPFPLIISLKKVREGEFKAVVPAGATFNYIIPVTVANGTINAGMTTLTIPRGRVESGTLTVTRTAGTTAHVTVNIGTLPNLPRRNHYGYALVKSDNLPRVIIRGTNIVPVFSDGTTTMRSVAENTARGVNIGVPVSAINADHDTLTYTLSGTDAVAFSIDSTSGQLQTKAALDYETKTSYSVTVSVSDGFGGSDSIAVTINVTDVYENRAPAFSEGDTTTRAVAENTVRGSNIGDAVSATDPDAQDTLTYTLSGTDASAFDIDSTSGQLQTKAALDYETKTSYSVAVSVSDGYGGSDSIAVVINVTDVYENRAPVFSEGSTATRAVAENTARRSNIGDAVSATDPDTQDTLTYSLSGTDASAFDIDSTTGQISTKSALDYETKSTYSVTLTVSDGQATDAISVTINVTDVHENRAPAFSEGSTANRTVAENTARGSNIGDAVSATDPDAHDTLTYSLSGTDASVFDIDSRTGQLQTKAALDYEMKTSYSVTVSVSDGNGGSASITVTINVTDVTERLRQQSTNRAPIFTEGSTTSRSVAEYTGSGVDIGSAVSATDADGDTLIYTLGGTDAASFSLNSTNGQLRTNAALDYETKSTYSVSVSVSDGTLTATIVVTINITDVYELPVQVTRSNDISVNNAPVFTDGSSTSRSVAENTGSGVDIGSAVSATDADGDILIYTLGGTDAASFSLNSTNGQLRTNAALDYETKSTYSVSVSVSDGTLTATIVVTINITDVYELPVQVTRSNDISVNNAPVFTDGSTTSRSVAENTGSGVDIGSAVSATDADGDILTYTLGGKDGAAFTINSTTGQLRTKAVLDYETKVSYVVTITVSDGSLTDSINVIDVFDTNKAPVFTDGTSTTRSVAENAANGTNIGSPISATDPDNGDLTYTLGGTDSYAFYIVHTTGQLQLSTTLDYETKNVYTVTVSVMDSEGGSDSITVTINVTDIIAPNYPLYGRTQQLQDVVVSDMYVNSADEVTAAHLADITWLELDDAGITALKAGDFDGFTSLKTLNLSDNSISDISPIRNLTTLLSLSFIDNSISDISALEKLTKLEFLNMSGNSVSDISPLRNLTQLKDLSLAGNSISNISALGNLTALIELNMGDNSISDISALEDLTALTALYLNHNSISNISALKNLTALKIIYLDNNSVSDISAVENLTALTWLTLPDNSISDISAVENLTALTHLGLYDNSISDISALGNLTKLTWLGLSDNAISDVAALENLTTLTSLSLRGNPISDYGPLRRLKAVNTGVYIDIDINNNPPVFTDGSSTSRSVAENTAASTDIGSAVSATDSDTDDTLTYSLGGTDAESFSIVSTSGQLQTKAALDYETKSSYTVTIDVSDGNDGLDRITVTINVTDVAGAAPPVETPPIIPDNTVLLTNFPNPFNPETWIPYQLAKPAEVALTIYNMRGVVVRQLKLGHQAAGVYTSRSRAIHWDGRNSIGEKVATGLYLYTLTAGDFSATRRMLIRK